MLLSIMLLAAATDDGGGMGAAQLALNIVGPAGLIAAIVSLLKLKPDANSQAVTQAQGAAAEWQRLYLQAMVDKKYEQTRRERAEELAEELSSTPDHYKRLFALRDIDKKAIESEVKAEIDGGLPHS